MLSWPPATPANQMLGITTRDWRLSLSVLEQSGPHSTTILIKRTSSCASRGDSALPELGGCHRAWFESCFRDGFKICAVASTLVRCMQTRRSLFKSRCPPAYSAVHTFSIPLRGLYVVWLQAWKWTLAQVVVHSEKVKAGSAAPNHHFREGCSRPLPSVDDASWPLTEVPFNTPVLHKTQKVAYLLEEALEDIHRYPWVSISAFKAAPPKAMMLVCLATCIAGGVAAHGGMLQDALCGR